MKDMKTVYICSPYRGDYIRNIERARHYSRIAFMQDCIPITPHLFYDTVLDDADEHERQQGMYAGLQLLKFCDEIWVFGEPTQGMQAEINRAKALGIKTIYYAEEVCIQK